MFHRSAHDNPRPWESRRMRYDTQKNGMSSILSHDKPPTPAPPSRASSGVAAALGVGEEVVAEYGAHRGRRHPTPACATGSEMDQLMHGISKLDAPSRKQYSAAAGTAMQTLLYCGQEVDANTAPDDPFAHCRGSRQTPHHPRQSSPPPAPTASAPMASPHEGTAQYHKQVYLDFIEAVRTAPRDADGSLSSYTALLQLLRDRGIELSTDGAGTLIATCDVRGEIDFEGFLYCLSLANDEQARAQSASQQQQSQQPSHSPSQEEKSQHPSQPQPKPQTFTPHPPMQQVRQLQFGEYESREWQKHTWRRLNLLPAGAPTFSPTDDQRDRILAARIGPNGVSSLSNLMNGDPNRFSRKDLEERLR